jgi:hypothetical protein
MKKFWLLYLILFISGSLAIYLKAPLISEEILPYVPSCLKPNDPSLAKTTYVTNTVVGTIVPKEPSGETLIPKKVVVPKEETFVSPALEGIYFARSTEQPAWGVTHQKTSFYNEKGANRGILEGGEIFVCRNGKLSSSKGDILECRLLAGSLTNSTLFIARKDAHFFTGDYTKLTKKQIEMLSEYYQLNVKLIERKKKLLEEGAARNPYFQSSRTAYLALSKNIEEAKATQQKLATATDAVKTALDQQMRAFKMKEMPLKAVFEAEQKKFMEWKQLHAKELPNPDTDSQMKTWRDQKAKLIPALPGLAF